MNHEQVLNNKLCQFSSNEFWQGKPEKREGTTKAESGFLYNDVKLNLAKNWENVEAYPDQLFELLSVDGHPICSTLYNRYRNSDNFISHSVALVDIDHEMTIEQLEVNQFYLDNGFAYYSTPSHTESAHRFRIIFILENDISNAADMRSLYIGLMSTFGDADPKCKDAARFFHGTVNATRTGRNNKVLAKAVIDELIDLGKKTEQNSTPKNKSVSENEAQAHGEQIRLSVPSEPLNLDIQTTDKYIKKCADILAKSKKGQFHDDRLKAGKLAGGYIASGIIDELDAITALKSVSMQISQQCGDGQYWADKEFQAVLDGIREGKNSPLKLDNTDYKLHQLSTIPITRRDYVDAQTASKQIQNLTDVFFQLETVGTTSGKIVAIKASASIGKTTAVIQSIAKYSKDKVVYIYVPTHELAEELVHKIRDLDASIKVIHRFGRDKTCQRNDLADAVQEKGLPVFQTLCDNNGVKCPFYETCQYINQFDDKYNIIILPHSNLGQEHSKLEQKPDLVVIDETFYNQLIKQGKGLEFKHLDSYDVLGKDKKTIKEAMIFANTGIGLFSALKTGFGCNSSSGLIKRLTYLKAVIGFQMSRSRDGGKFLTNLINEVNSDIEQNDCDAITNIANIKTYKREYALISTLLTELEQFPDRSKSNSVLIENGHYFLNSKSTNNRVINYIERGTPILMIDADFDLELMEQLLVVNIEHHEIQVKRNVNVKQCFNSTFAKNKFFRKSKDNPDLREVGKAVQNIMALAKEAEKTLVVSYMKLIPFLRSNIKNKNISFEHFGNLRGKDCYKDFDTVIMIGRQEPNVSAIENMAAAIWSNDVEPINRTKSFEFKDGQKYHVDHRVNILLKLICQAEGLQAIDRLRTIHSPVKKTVYILSNQFFDLAVDEYFNSNDLVPTPSKNDVLFDKIYSETGGILPLSSAFFLSRYPDDFKSIGQVRMAVSRFIQSYDNNISSISNILIGTLLLSSASLITVNYRVQSQPSKSKDLMTLANSFFSDRDILAKLETAHGEQVILKKWKNFTAIAEPHQRSEGVFDMNNLDGVNQPTEQSINQFKAENIGLKFCSSKKPVDQTEPVEPVNTEAHDFYLYYLDLYRDVNVLSAQRLKQFDENIGTSWVKPSKATLARRAKFRCLDNLELMAA